MLAKQNKQVGIILNCTHRSEQYANTSIRDLFEYLLSNAKMEKLSYTKLHHFLT